MKLTAKRLTIFLLSLVLAALAAFAAVRIIRLLAYTVGDYTFAVLEDGSAEIRNYKGSAASLSIPSTLRNRRHKLFFIIKKHLPQCVTFRFSEFISFFDFTAQPV